jgi:hypothetical protein
MEIMFKQHGMWAQSISVNRLLNPTVQSAAAILNAHVTGLQLTVDLDTHFAQLTMLPTEEQTIVGRVDLRTSDNQVSTIAQNLLDTVKDSYGPDFANVVDLLDKQMVTDMLNDALRELGHQTWGL